MSLPGGREGSSAVESTGLIVVHRATVDPTGAAAGRGEKHPARASIAALRGLDLRVEAGEIVAVVGPSGSGKTSLLRVLAGAERPTAGTVTSFGVDLDRAEPSEIARYRRETVAVVDQHYRRALSPYLPAIEIAALPLALRGANRSSCLERARELLGAMGLGDRPDARAGEFSGGEQQRLAVAAALSIRPRLLLADEPTGELDAEATERLLTLVRDLVRAEGTTAIIVTHDPAVEAIADRVVILEDGRAVAVRTGPPAEPEVPAVDSARWRAPERTWRHAEHGVPAAATPVATAASAGTAVELEHVSRHYGAGSSIPALVDLSARIATGGVTVITGPSGSGKSTLLRLVAGLDLPNEGTVRVLGRDLATLDREGLAAMRASEVGIAEQARGLVPFLDVRENVELAVALHVGGAGGNGRDARVDAILERLGIGGLAGRHPTELSAGERTRVAIARALVAAPQILLLDEPSATLDRVNASRIAALLAELGREVTVVVATHDPALIAVARGRLDLAGQRTPVETAGTAPAR